MVSGGLGAVVFGLASALTWGAGDFCGGLATKRGPVFGVLVIGQTIGLLLMLALAFMWGEPLPSSTDFGWGLAAGLASTVGLASLYRALAVGQMGIVAPLSAVISAALPALFGITTEGMPGALKLLGFALALVGIWLVAGTGSSGGERKGLGLAVLAGCGFGVFLILLHRVGTSAIFWPLVAARGSSLVLVLPIAIARRQLLQPGLRLLMTIMLAGALDVIGNAFFVLAGQSGRLDVAAILSSLYPATTVLLAALLLGERLMRLQVVGVVAALAAIALIAI